MNKTNPLVIFCSDFCKVLEKHAKYITVSGFVALATGRSRNTEDIDIISERLPFKKFEALHKDLLAEKYTCMQSINPSIIYNDYLNENLSVRYIRDDIPIPNMELKFAKDKIDEHQLANRIKIPLTLLDVWFSSIETNIAFKEEYLKSQKDMEDALHLRTVFGDTIKEPEIIKMKKMIRELRMDGR